MQFSQAISVGPFGSALFRVELSRLDVDVDLDALGRSGRLKLAAILLVGCWLLRV